MLQPLDTLAAVSDLDELISVDNVDGEITPLGLFVPSGKTNPVVGKIGDYSYTDPGMDVVWGGFLGGSTGADILLYDRDTGLFEFRAVDSSGDTYAFYEKYGTRGWSHVVPGDYNGDDIADLLFYRASDGLMRFYTITADGTFRAMTPIMYGNRGWTQMIPGDFDANGTDDLLWYRATDGLMRFYTVSGTRFTPMTPVMYGNRNWSQIPSGDFDGDGRDDLMYYRSNDGLYRFYTISADGRFTAISDVGYTDTGWNQILAGQFNMIPGADLVFYKSGTIQALGYSTTKLVPITDEASAPSDQILTVLNWSAITGTHSSFGDGTWRVGTDIAAGTYRNSDSSGGCYWARLSGFGDTLDEIIANEFTYGRSIVTISPTDLGFESNDCGLWSTDLSPITSSPTAPFGDGTYQVGTEIAAGLWRNSTSADSCYWQRLSGFGGTLDDVIVNDFTDSIATVWIDPGDLGFSAERCGTWTKIEP